MIHNKIIKDERGTINIQVTLLTFQHTPDINGNYFRYDTHTRYKAKGKRLELYAPSIATDAEILEAKKELWQKLNPLQ